MAGGALRVEGLDEVLERHVLVLVRTHAALPHPGEEFLEGRVARGVRPQDVGVDEETYEVVEGFVRAARHTTAQRDVGPRTQPGQQRRHTGLQHHEHRRVRPPRQLHQTPMQLSIQSEVDPCPLVAGGGRPGPVGREGHLLRQVRQLGTPVVELLCVDALRVVDVAEPVALPERVVDVLRGQFGPFRVALLDTGGVRLHHITRQRSHRPAVTRDVMQQQQQRAVFRVRVEQPGPEGDLGGEVEGVPGRLAEGALQVGLGHRPPLPPEVGLVEVPYQLVGLAVHVGEDGAQRLVPADDIEQGRVQCLGVDGAGEAEGQRHVVGRRAAFHPVQEPQAALGERQRHHVGAFDTGERGARAVGGRSGEPPGQRGGCGEVEDLLDLQLFAEGGTDPDEQPDRRQRMTAEFEEVVVGADVVPAECLGEQGAQRLLARCLGVQLLAPSSDGVESVLHRPGPAHGRPLRRSVTRWGGTWGGAWEGMREGTCDAARSAGASRPRAGRSPAAVPGSSSGCAGGSAAGTRRRR